ncbi:hypothetical protein FQR65_LT19135 [Abscondita terminalis]|nr:hypothetical protein FQR65_LT19135 [Abscondita terminalis]
MATTVGLDIMARCEVCDLIERKSTLKNHICIVPSVSCSPFPTEVVNESDVEFVNSQSAESTQDHTYHIQPTNSIEGEEQELIKQTAKGDIFHWSDNATKLFLSLYEKHKDKFQSAKFSNKSVWKIIATAMSKESYSLTSEQVENKFKNLKKTYKKIIDNNKQTGRGTISWPYFDLMDAIFGSKPEVTPLRLVSSSSTININSQQENSENVPPENDARCIIKRAKRSHPVNDAEPAWFKTYSEDCERRHKERMTQQQKLIDAIEKLTE